MKFSRNLLSTRLEATITLHSLQTSHHQQLKEGRIKEVMDDQLSPATQTTATKLHHDRLWQPYPSEVSEAVQGGDARPLPDELLATVNLLHLVSAGGTTKELQLKAATIGECLTHRLDCWVAKSTSLNLQS